ncbi:T9SS type A sorting domain-containing protein [Flavobacterium hiemivividum]|uniref:T9SS type A sorting domain-containing protein n=1 Tax=Flavobacterium hiemivividum TaxID=2541734 RepID=UPI001A9E7575|nr:T9SS type A sorting domain-containing protein [Flavobacterium hiemivividum]
MTVAGCPSAAGSTTVVVNPIPATPTASNNGPLCVGSTLNLTTPLVSGATYSWTGPNSFSSGLQNPSISGVTLATAGTYNVIVTVAGCPSAEGSTTVVVNPIPATPTASNNGPLCVGSTLNLTTPLVSGATYSWTGPNSFSSGLQNPSISGVNLATAGTYNVIVTVAGCPSAAGSTTVVVNPLLTPSVVITSSSTSICSGTSVTFTATPTNGGSAPSYQWKNGATLVGTNSPTYTTTTLASNAAISVVMTSNAICPSPSTATSNNIVMNVFTGTPSGWNGSTNITVSNQSICPPATVTLSVPAASNAQYYQWNLPTGWIITNGNLTNSITVSVSSSAALGTQVIAVKAINPCGENTKVSTPSNGKNQIIVNSFNGVTISPSSQTVCANSSIIVTGLLTGNATSGNWTATNGNITLQSQVGSTITAVFTPTISGGSATATITTNTPTGSCPNTPATATVAVTVSPLPIAAGTINGSATVCQGQNSVTYTVPDITNATGYTWSLPTGATIANGANTNSITINYSNSATSGNIAVYGTNACGNGTVSANFAVTVNPLPIAAGTINGSATVCQGQNSVAYTVPDITNATGYTWSLPTGATIANGANTNSITINYSNSATSGNIAVYGTNACGNGTVSANFAVTVNPLPITAGTINGSATVCQGQNSVAYTVPDITNATGYTWSLPTGATIANGANTNSITINYSNSATSGNIAVYGTNACGNGTVSANFAVTVNPLPIAAGTINGSATVCQAQNSVTYAVPDITNATGYTWSLPTGATIANGANTNSITINYSNSATSGNIAVYGTNACGNGTVSANFAVTVNPLPIAAGTINGSATVCQAQNSLTYAVPDITNATGYTWSLPTGATIANGANTNSITINYSNSATSGNIAVYGTNACGNGTVSANFAVTVNPLPIAAGTINGSATVCQGQNSVTYAVPDITNATGYTWSLPTGATIANGANTNSITINYSNSATSGNIAVYGTNACGNGTVSANFAVTVNPLPIAAGTINGSATVCQGQNSVTYAVPDITNATGYIWSLPTGATIANGANTNSITVNYSNSATSGNIAVYGTNTCGNGTVSANFAVTVNQPPAINTQPNPSQTVCSGFPVSFSVITTGTGFTYQWKKGGANVLGATSNTYSIPNVSAVDAGTYTVTVSGTSPCAPVTSENAVLIVNQDIEITSQPIAQINCEGKNTSFSVTATGNISSYVWRKNGIPISNGGNISGATTPTITFTGLLLSNVGNYDVVISSPGGSCSQTLSNPASLTVTPVPTATISYAGTPFCNDITSAQSVNLSGSNAYTGGSYSAPTGLTLNASTGAITPSTSTAGSYAVTYTIAATGGCNAVTATTNITITAKPTANISYAGASFCKTITGVQAVTLTGTNAYIGGTFSAPAGLTINSTTGEITPSTSTAGNYTVTYLGPTTGGCVAATATATVTITALPTAALSYSGSPYCKDITTAQTANLTGNTGGIYSAAPAGLSIDTGSGAITPSTSIAGSYVVTYTIAAAGGCSEVTATANITITAIPTATISYAGAPFCKTIAGVQTVTLSGTNTYSGGTFTAPAGLIINSTTGEITPASSTAGNYTVTYTGSTSGGCAAAIATTSITITGLPTATISYSGTPYCKNTATGQAVTLSGTNAYTGGTYSAPTGLTLNASSGAITPSTSTAGNYLVTYTILAAGGCSAVTATANVTITAIPTATINYAATQFCNTLTGVQAVTLAGTNAYSGGTFTAPAGLTINSITGGITPSSSAAGNYTVTYLGPTSGGCTAATATATVTITALPTATISYSGSPYCKNIAIGQAVTLSGSNAYTGGTYTVSPTGLTLNAATGAITPSTSAAGNYLVTYTILAAGGCNAVTATANVTITAIHTATISYASIPFCKTISGIRAVTLSGTNAYSGGTFAAPSGLSINSTTGEITPSTSTAGTYTVTYTGSTNGGCAAAIATTSITITGLPTATISYTVASFCISNSTGQAVTLSGTNAYTGGTYTVSPTGLTLNASTGAITPSSSTAGTYTVTYTIPAAAGCTSVATSTTIKIDPVPIGGTLLFQTPGTTPKERLFLICQNPSSGYAVPLSLSGIVGTVVKWQYRTSTATSWSIIPDGVGNFTGNTLTAAQVESLNITQSTVIRVEISSGACSPNVFSETAIISVIPQDIAPSPVAVNKSVICIGTGIQLSSETGYGESFGKFEGGAFDNSSITNSGWRITDKNGITNYDFSSNADNTRPDRWLRTNPHDFATANITAPYTIIDKRWDTSLSSAGNKGFAIVSGNNTSTLETAIFSLAALDEAILTFDQAYNLTSGAVIKVEISTNGGASYSSEPILFQQSGSVSSGNYDRFGEGTPGINQMQIDLGDYIGYSNLRIRFNYTGKRDGDIWTLDNIKVPEGPRDVTLVWTDDTDPTNPIVIGTTNNVTWTPSKIGWNTFVVKTSLILDSAGNTCSSPVNEKEIKVFAFDQYTATTMATAVGCGTKNVPLSVNVISGKQGPITTYPTADGYVGEWSITGPAGFVLTNPNPSNPIAPINNPNAIFTAADIGSYIFKWILAPTTKDENGLTITNTNCAPNYVAPTLIIQHCTTLDFDGIDDYVDLGTGFNGSYSIEAWIRPKTNIGTIISGPTFEIKISDLPVTIIPNSRWYHIAMSNGKIYVDGIEMKNAGTGIGGTKTIIGARWNNTSGKPENYFTGWIEEVRIWNKNITQEQIRFMMNQHLQNATNIGVEIPIPVEGGLVYSDLAGYYRLISEFPDSSNLQTYSNTLKPVNGITPNLAIAGTPAVLYNMTTHQQNTAPMPYISAADGKWTDINTWLRPTVWDIPNSNGLNASPIDWNIVITRNNTTSDAKDITVLGLKSESGKLTMADPAPAPQNETNGGRMLWITHYLKLDGNIDLVGESQLLQKRYGSYDSDFYFSTAQVSESIFDEASSGFIKRDQQGKKNSFNYNYWSSPVTLQGNPNNAPYTIAGVLRDGTVSAIPKAINFQYGAYDADGPVTSPIKTTYRWIWSYNSLTPDSNTDWQNYYQWNYVGTNAIKVGNGFTMKGSGGTAAINATQNYAFIGKPNSGDVDLTIGLNQTYLIGNPYPSALDANQFIRDNLKDCVGCPAAGGFNGTANTFSGALYFWDHFGLSNNHILAQYEGGYATYTLLGGSPGVSDSPLTATANNAALLAPKRYIPVGQGFFINAAANPNKAGTSAAVQGGTIKIRNNQRVYYRETSASSLFLKTAGTKKSAAIKIPEDNRSKIRLGFDAPNGKHRQLLVAADPNTTNQFDIGYDAEIFDAKDNDMYWEIEDSQLVIQGIPNFDDNQIIPIGINTAKEGLSTIKIDALENIPDRLEIYLFDNVTGLYHDIKNNNFTISLPVGKYNKRFSLQFVNKTLSVDSNTLEDGILIYYSNVNQTLNIHNNFIDAEVTKVDLFNLSGQKIAHWVIEEVKQNNIKIPIANVSTAGYIVKVTTTKGAFSKKIIIK